MDREKSRGQKRESGARQEFRKWGQEERREKAGKIKFFSALFPSEEIKMKKVEDDIA